MVIRVGAERWRFLARRVDLAREFAHCLAEPYDGLTLSALVDLASAAWIDALAA